MVVDQIRDTCPNVNATDWVCPDVDLDDDLVQSILQRISNDEAMLAHQLRRQGLFTTQQLLVRAADAVNTALESLGSAAE